jgi:cyclophilin family peptidyl-prolyl cis-trans isomerase
MNYLLEDIPYSGENPIVFMDILLKGELFGRIMIRLFRDSFPAGVENFVRIASGKTYRIEPRGTGRYTYEKVTRRTYEGCRFFNYMFNNYAVTGDIYNNDGSNAGTIYHDEPIPAILGPAYYPHETIGLVSLVPFVDELNGQPYYDSTFMITLDDANPLNIISELNTDQVVIGQVYEGLDVLVKMNEMIQPYAGRKYPDFKIGTCGVRQLRNGNTRIV